MHNPPTFDLSELSEDDRVDFMGRMVTREMGAFGFEARSAEEADRIIAKLAKAFPGICVTGRMPGSMPGSVAIKIEPFFN